MNQRIATLKWRGAALVVCSGVMACIVPACGGDDTTAPVDSGADVTTPEGDATPDVGTTPPDTGTGADAPVDHSVVETSTPDATSDVHVVDAHADATADATTSEAGDASTAPDVAAEAEAAAPLAPLALCPVFDLNDDGVLAGMLGGGQDADALTRADAWGNDVAAAFATALTNDCRANGIQAVAFDTNGTSDPTKVAAYLDQVARYTVDLMGCGDSEAGAPNYQNLLIPPASHVYSIADANVLTELYVNAVLQATSTDWADTFAIEGMFPSPQPLTGDQFNLIQAMVESLQAGDANLNPSTTRQSSINTCGADAGAEGGTDASTTTGDAGDASSAGDATSD
jgi:hypothetical protein